MKFKADIIVVGSGAGGATVAKELAKRESTLRNEDRDGGKS